MPGFKVFVLLVSISYCTANAILQEYEDRDWIDYRLARAGFGAESTDVSISCSTPGPFCHNCKEIYLCYTNDTGHLEAEKLAECDADEGLTCNGGVCSKIPTQPCALDEIDFDCVSNEGMYPAPGNCRDFHYCAPDENKKIKKHSSDCGQGSEYAYNPVTTYCDVKLPETGCPDVVPLCDKPGQSGIINNKPSMYYICKPYKNTSKLYPYLYLCKNGRQYDPAIFGCQPPQ